MIPMRRRRRKVVVAEPQELATSTTAAVYEEVSVLKEISNLPPICINNSCPTTTTTMQKQSTPQITLRTRRKRLNRRLQSIEQSNSQQTHQPIPAENLSSEAALSFLHFTQPESDSENQRKPQQQQRKQEKEELSFETPHTTFDTENCEVPKDETEASNQTTTKIVSRKNMRRAINRRRRVLVAEEKNQEFPHIGTGSPDLELENTPSTPMTNRQVEALFAKSKSPRTPHNTPRTPRSNRTPSRYHLMSNKNSAIVKIRNAFLLSPGTVDVMRRDGRYIQTPKFNRNNLRHQSFLLKKQYKKKGLSYDRPAIEQGVTEAELCSSYTLNELKLYCQTFSSKAYGTKQELAQRIVEEILPKQGPPLLTSPMVSKNGGTSRNKRTMDQIKLLSGLCSDSDEEEEDQETMDSLKLEVIKHDSDRNHIYKRRKLLLSDDEYESDNAVISSTTTCRPANMSPLDYYHGLRLYTPSMMKSYCQQVGILDSGNRQELKRRILSYLESTKIWQQQQQL